MFTAVLGHVALGPMGVDSPSLRSFKLRLTLKHFRCLRMPPSRPGWSSIGIEQRKGTSILGVNELVWDEPASSHTDVTRLHWEFKHNCGGRG